MSLSQKEEAELLALLEAENRTKSPFTDEWDFLARAVITKDEASGRLRPFPHFEYLEHLTRRRRETYYAPSIHAYEKSRRLLISWWLLCLYLYDTLTQPNHANFVGSRKLESSAYFLGEERILGVYNRIPADEWPNKPRLVPGAKHKKGYESLHCPETGSYLQAIASGADQLRQYTASNIFADEIAFWERWQESWGAMLPCIEGGGHIDLVTTPDLGAEAEAIYYPEVLDD
jgi:hypothetical protein